MANRGLATAGSIVLHGAVIAALMFSWPAGEREPLTISSVPVSIVSDVQIAAAPADNPADEVVEAETVPDPAPTPPEPTPPEPAPQPTPTPPRKTPPTPTPTPAPRPAEKARPTPPREPARPATPPRQETPPRKTPPRQDPGLDLGSLAGPPRKAPPGQATGDRGQGQAARATGAQISNLAGQIGRHWVVNCDVPGVRDLSVPMRITISSSGRIVSGPTVANERSDATWRAAVDSMQRAARAAEPFDVPSGFETQEISIRFRADQFCRDR